MQELKIPDGLETLQALNRLAELSDFESVRRLLSYLDYKGYEAANPLLGIVERLIDKGYDRMPDKYLEAFKQM